MYLLKRYPKFFLFSLALTLSGIGSALTGVAIYELMRQQGMPPENYALMFALTFLPAFFASELGKRLALSVRFSAVFVIFNILGIIVCSANLWNLSHQQTWIHYATILFGGIVNGVYFPLYQILLKRTISETDLPALSVYETVIFGLQFILGELLGTLLFSMLGPANFFQADILTFLICSAVVGVLAYQGQLSFDPIKSEEK
ncbi:MAG: MFS transporter, partial [Proteobacteria bacterium]